MKKFLKKLSFGVDFILLSRNPDYRLIMANYSEFSPYEKTVNWLQDCNSVALFHGLDNLLNFLHAIVSTRRSLVDSVLAY